MLGIRREALQGALITLALIFDFAVFRSLNPKETSQLLIYAGHQFARLREDTPRHRIYKAKKRWTQQIHLLANFARRRPGSGLLFAGPFWQRRSLHYRNRSRTGKSARYWPKDGGRNTRFRQRRNKSAFKGAARAHLKAIA